MQSGDYCGKIEASFAITMAQLQLWNPDIKDDCSNLQLGVAYCVDGQQAAATAGAVANTDTTSTAAATAAVKFARSVPTPAPAAVEMQPYGRLANQWFAEAHKVASMRMEL